MCGYPRITLKNEIQGDSLVQWNALKSSRGLSRHMFDQINPLVFMCVHDLYDLISLGDMECKGLTVQTETIIIKYDGPQKHLVQCRACQ